MQVLTETLAWMAETVEEFGLGMLDVKLLIEWMKADLGSSNAGVRNGAITLLGAMHRQLGPGLAPMLSQHVKPALMTTLDATFKANPPTQARTLAAPVAPLPAVPACQATFLRSPAFRVCLSDCAGGADAESEGQGSSGADWQEAGGCTRSGCGCC